MRSIVASLFTALAVAVCLSPAMAAGSGKVYMTDLTSDSVYVSDPSAVETWGKVKTGMGPERLAGSPDGRYAYVSVKGEDKVVAIDAATDKVVHSITVEKNPGMMAVTPDGTKLMVCSDSLGVSVIDTALFTQTGKLPLKSGAADIKVSPGGGEAYVAEGKRIEVIDIGKTAVKAWVDVSYDANLIEMSGKKLYVYGMEDRKIHVLDADSLKETGAMEAGWGMRMSPDGGQLWFNGPAEKTVSVYSTAESKVVATLPRDSERSSCYFAFSPDGKQVFVGLVGKDNDRVDVLDSASLRKTGELKAPSGLGSIIYLSR